MGTSRMKLQLLRINSGVDATSGVLYRVYPEGDKKFLCYTLEDEHRDVKVMGETRIPAGTYTIEFRSVGGYHSRELKSCLLYTSPSPRDGLLSRMPSSA